MKITITYLKNISVAFFLLTIASMAVSLKAQVIIDENVNPNRILRQLVGAGVTITNININCPGNRTTGLSYARFVSNNPDFPLDSGIVLTTGRAANAVGPNNATDLTTGWNSPGDTDLAAIAGLSIFDACVITFDVVPVGNRLRFRYTFASEEYEEFTPCTGQNINDAFAFLITGSNPSGGNYNKKNIALLPNTNIPVSINNVNQCTNTAYYQNNNGGVDIQYDGYTVNLIAEVDVTPCSTYTLALKIGDGFDGLFDSAVFVEEITSEVPQFSLNTNSVIDEVVAGCVNGEIEVGRDVTNRAETYVIDFGGTAIAGTDFIVNIEGTPAASYPFNINYAIGEDLRNLTFLPSASITEARSSTIYLRAGCSNEIIDSLVIDILPLDDIVPIPEYPDGIVYRCIPNQVIELESRLADNYTWSSSNGVFTCLDPDCRRIRLINATTETTYNLEIEIGDCTFDQDIQILPSNLSLTEDAINICVGESTSLEATGRDTYSWSPATGLSCTDCPNPIATPTETTTYTVTGTQSTCNSTASVVVTVIQEAGPEIENLQSGYCITANPVALQADPSGGVFSVQGNGVNIPNASVFDPASLGVGIYEVNYVLGTGGNCSEETTRTVEVYALPNEPAFSNLLDEYCVSDVSLTLQGSPSSSTSFFTIDGSASTTFNPSSLGVGVYQVVYIYQDANGCQNTTQKEVEVKALPQLAFNNVAEGYCVAETSILISVIITEANGQSRTEIIETINPSIIGVRSYTINFEYEGINSCRNEIEKTIVIYPQPVLDFIDLDVEYCDASLPFTLMASPAGGIFLVNGASQTQFDPTAFEPGDTPQISYSYTDPNGCSEEINQRVVITAASIDSNNPESFILTVCPPEFIGYDLEAVSESEKQEGYTYLWQPTGDITRTINISEKAQEGNYSVITRDIENCPVAYKSFDITVDCQPVLQIPTAFSPNNDLLNDQLEVLGKDFASLEFKVYNRWGELVFETLTQEVSWDGRWNGKEASVGIYIWAATYINILTGETFKKQGKITLLR